MNARPGQGTTKQELQGFVHEQASYGAAVHTDMSPAYASLEGFEHDAVIHSAGEYVRGAVHTNGIESFWILFKRGLYGTYRHMSGEHLQRYLAEFSGCHNVGELNTANQRGRFAGGLNGRQLTWKMLAGRARSAAAA